MKHLLATLTLSLLIVCSTQAQVPLPNNAMYDLVDCGNSTERFEHYLTSYQMAPAEDLPSYYRWKHEGRLAESIRELDSLNRSRLRQVLDTLAKYSMTRKDQTFEQFTWLFDEHRGATFSHQNFYQFKKGDRIFHVKLGSLELIQGHWRLTDQILFRMLTAEKENYITCSTTLPQDPKDFGHHLTKSLQAGNLEDVLRLFLSREVVEKSYGKERESEVERVMTDIKAEQKKISDRIQQMKPGAYTVSLKRVHWERVSSRSTDMDKGNVDFIINNEGKTIPVSMKFNVLETGIYVYQYREER